MASGTGGLSAIAIGTTAAGAVLVWSGIRGSSVLTTVQDIIKGDKPKGANVNPIDAPADTSGTGGAGGGAGGGPGPIGGAGAMVTLAKTQVGYRETGINQQKYCVDLKQPAGPWCAYFLWWLAVKTGNGKLVPHTGSAPGMAQAFGGQFVSGSAGIKAGDLVFYMGASNGWNNIGHCGIAATDNTGGSWQSVEGNYGDKVALNTRSSCQGHARPNYGS